jgi:acyl-CoA thioester hydrolase
MSALPSADIEICVPFHDIDPLGVVWHGHYAKYFEIARCALLDTIGYSYQEMADSGFAWPVIDFQLRFINAVRFNQVIRVHAQMLEWEYRMKIAYHISDAASGSRLTRGHTTQVAVTLDRNELQLISPPVLARKLGLA